MGWCFRGPPYAAAFWRVRWGVRRFSRRVYGPYVLYSFSCLLFFHLCSIKTKFKKKKENWVVQVGWALNGPAQLRVRSWRWLESGLHHHLPHVNLSFSAPHHLLSVAISIKVEILFFKENWVVILECMSYLRPLLLVVCNWRNNGTLDNVWYFSIDTIKIKWDLKVNRVQELLTGYMTIVSSVVVIVSVGNAALGSECHHSIRMLKSLTWYSFKMDTFHTIYFPETAHYRNLCPVCLGLDLE